MSSKYVFNRLGMSKALRTDSNVTVIVEDRWGATAVW
jgi:hypothetical protein